MNKVHVNGNEFEVYHILLKAHSYITDDHGNLPLEIGDHGNGRLHLAIAYMGNSDYAVGYAIHRGYTRGVNGKPRRIYHDKKLGRTIAEDRTCIAIEYALRQEPIQDNKKYFYFNINSINGLSKLIDLVSLYSDVTLETGISEDIANVVRALFKLKNRYSEEAIVISEECSTPCCRNNDEQCNNR